MTIVAIATPPGSGALGIVRLSGPEASSIAARMLDLPKEGLVPRHATLSRASAGEETIDHVIAVFFPGPQSATGEDLIELSAHGSPYILKRLVQEALRLGARAAGPGEFTQRAYLNGRMDLAQAEAVSELIKARAKRSHGAALDQLEGGLSRLLGEISAPLMDILIGIEASLDHPEEDLPRPEPGRTKEALESVRRSLLGLAGSYSTGRAVIEGARVGIVGRTNAGKSSLFNALLARDRAIVCAEPGTTRDTIEEPAEIDGLPILLVDTAGLRDQAADDAELSGIERSERALAASDLSLLVIDSSRRLTPEDERLHTRIAQSCRRSGRPLITVASKSDREWQLGDMRCDVSVSSLRDQGLGKLRSLLAKSLLGQDRERQVLVLSARHHQALLDAAHAITGSLAAIDESPERWEDRAASRLRQALSSIGEINGVSAPKEILEGIFSRFCIGK